MTELLTHIISLINDYFLGYVLMAALIFAGLYFTITTRFVQFVRPKEMLKLMISGGEETRGTGHISPFQAFAISTAARVGTGNIAGVAIAITVGGPGAIFWMWLIAVIGSASAFAESTLAQIHKVKTGTHFRGGPAYYMKNALHSPKLGLAFSVIITLTFAFVFNSVQSNTIAQSLNATFHLDTSVCGIVLAALTAIIIFGGLKRIARFSAIIVPVFAGAYIILTLVVMILNLDKLPHVFGLIFSDAFSWHNVAGGTLGATIMTGARRGLFSNEAGMGSAPNAAATAHTSHPVKQGYVQAFSVFIDTLVICSCTAFIVLLSNYQQFPGLEGIALTQKALTFQLGNFGNYFLSASVLLFAFTSIIGNYYYGQANVEFITRKKSVMLVFRTGVTLMVLSGAVLQLKLVWNLADLFMAAMALMNIYAILRLRTQVIDALADYRKQKEKGLDPHFHPEEIPSIGRSEAWEK